MENEFLTWVTNELQDRGWSYSELARRADMSPSAVSLVLSEQRGITADFCIAVARALHTDPDQALRLAGILPSLPPPVEEEHEALNLFRQLGQDVRRVILATMRNLLGIRTISTYTINEAQEPYGLLETLTPNERERVLALISQMRDNRRQENNHSRKDNQ